MMRYIAFLRAINVGGRTVKMHELRARFTAMGFAAVETFVASGNVIFETDAADATALEARIAAELERSLGYDVATFLRSDGEVAAIAGYAPFPPHRIATAGALNVALLAAPLTPTDAERLMSLRSPIDDFHTNGREVYWLCQTKQSESTFSNAIFERVLGKRATFRGMSTIRKLATKYPPAVP